MLVSPIDDYFRIAVIRQEQAWEPDEPQLMQWRPSDDSWKVEILPCWPRGFSEEHWVEIRRVA